MNQSMKRAGGLLVAGLCTLCILGACTQAPESGQSQFPAQTSEGATTSQATGPADMTNEPSPVRHTDNLMESFKAQRVSVKTADKSFIGAAADFSLRLFEQSRDSEKNSLVSPLSVLLALSMTANGASGETLAEMERVLGGGMPMDSLNRYLKGFTGSLTSTESARLFIANSIWFRDIDDMRVKDSFLQTNANYYAADVYRQPFDQQTLRDINGWVKQNTDGMIPQILDELLGDLYLINAVAFDAKWQNPYMQSAVQPGTFTARGGERRTVSMMSSMESAYLEDEKATGFIKPFRDGQYQFAALLPKEADGLDAYAASLTGTHFVKLVTAPQKASVSAKIPKFTFEYDLLMNEALQSLGIQQAFNPDTADFSRMAETPSFIQRVLHRTFIDVNEAGTRAAAVTAVEQKALSARPDNIKTVTLDRPFLFAILDGNTGLPLFIGSVTDI